MSGPQRTSPRWGITPWVILCSISLALTFLFPSLPSSWALEQDLTPSQVVQQWIAVYPKDLDTAVTLTTPKLRNGLTPERWIRHFKSILANLGLEHLDGQVLSEEITGNRAVVMLKAYLSTIIGDQVQRERWSCPGFVGRFVKSE